MTDSIKIPVDATLNTAGIKQDAKEVGRALGGASDEAIRKLERVQALFQQYLKVDREFARLLKATGQEGTAFDDIDAAKMYPNALRRAAKMAGVRRYVYEEDAPPGTQRGGRHHWSQSPGGVATHVAQSGLRAAGPMGNVAANALGSGVSMGVGAGLGALVGGMAAMAVGKLVGAIAENVKRVQDQDIAFDRLKRQLGDVGVSFAALKTGLKESGNSLRVTYEETTRLAGQFSKLGNVSGEGYKSLPEELGIGVGLSRAFGLENEQGVGFLGQMRGVGMTHDTQESRRMALLIGETIGKSDAFAKAGEVMEAIGNFATTQTRQSLTQANVAGYAGEYAGLVSSKIPGLDPAGAANMLGRMNASLAAGGAKGEASQYATAQVANRMGISPLQMLVLREGGAFATKSSAFGKDSVYARYMGHSEPEGDTTFLEETRKLIEGQYKDDGTDESKLLRANAFANHTGLGMGQAMAFLSVEPAKMGELNKYAKYMKGGLTDSGYLNMVKSISDDAKDRQGVAQSLLGRDDLKKEDRDSINAAMSGSEVQTQKDVLAKLSAQYEQERTTGKDIADSRALLENIKADLAGTIAPAVSNIQKLLFLKEGKTPEQIHKEMLKQEAKATKNETIDALDAEEKQLNRENLKIRRSAVKGAGRKLTHHEADAVGKNNRRLAEIKTERDAANDKYKNAPKEIDEQLQKEREARKKNETRLGAVPPGADAEAKDGDKVAAPSIGAGAGAEAAAKSVTAETASKTKGIGTGAGAEALGIKGDVVAESIKDFMNMGWSRPQATGMVANLMEESALNHKAVGDKGAAYGIAQWHPDRQRDFEKWAGKSIRESSLAEQRQFVNYELTEGKKAKVGQLLKQQTTFGNSAKVFSDKYEIPDDKTGAKARERMATANRLGTKYKPTQLSPEELAQNQAPGRQADQRVTFNGHMTSDPTVVQINYPNGQQAAPPVAVRTSVDTTQPDPSKRRRYSS